MNRYTTKRYVAICCSEAERLAKLDGTPIENIRYAPNVDLLHRTDWWAYWSDEQVTTAISLPDTLQPKTLSQAAADLIFDVWASGLSAPHCGWALLTQVERVLSSERDSCQEVSEGFSSQEKLTLELTDGRLAIIYRCSRFSNCEYHCDFLSELPE
ncbi:MAG: hypothetical protein AAGC93_08000 [Cyanobacteria bacterium P01_F01_bin.53]